MEKKDTFKNKENWDDVSSFIDEASKKAHKKEQIKQIMIDMKGKLQSGKGKSYRE